MNKHMEKVIRKLEIETAMFLIVAVIVFGGVAGIANQLKTKAADPVSEFSQEVSAGTLAAFVRDDSRVVVGSPTVAFSGTTFSFDCLTGDSRSSGTLGTDSQRVYVDNPDAADGGWN